MVTMTSALPSVFRVIGELMNLEPLSEKTFCTSESSQEIASLPKASALSMWSTLEKINWKVL